MKSLPRTMFAAVLVVLLAGCSHSHKKSYDDILNDAATAFEAGDYAAALQLYTKARDKKPNLAEAYSGMGWSYLKLDSLQAANTIFSSGSTKTDPSAELYAGWSFILNALKDYAGSNTQAAAALALDSAWQFQFGLGLSSADLHVTRAENFLALGDFPNAKIEVVILDASFASVDVTTDSGKAQLASKIEALKLVSKIRIAG